MLYYLICIWNILFQKTFVLEVKFQNEFLKEKLIYLFSGTAK